jgi:hypothetical protein
MRAPQFGKVRDPMPPGPNPEALKGLRVKPFANIFALVEGLGVISLHKTETDAKAALEGEIERRQRFNASRVLEDNDAVKAPNSAHGGGAEQEAPTQGVMRQPPDHNRQAEADDPLEERAYALRHD